MPGQPPKKKVNTTSFFCPFDTPSEAAEQTPADKNGTESYAEASVQPSSSTDQEPEDEFLPAPANLPRSSATPVLSTDQSTLENLSLNSPPMPTPFSNTPMPTATSHITTACQLSPASPFPPVAPPPPLPPVISTNTNGQSIPGCFVPAGAPFFYASPVPTAPPLAHHPPVPPVPQLTPAGLRPTKSSVDAALEIRDRLDKVERELKATMGMLSKVQVLTSRVEELEKDAGRIADLEEQLAEANAKIEVLEHWSSDPLDVDDADDEAEGKTGRAGAKKGKKGLPGEDSRIQKALVTYGKKMTLSMMGLATNKELPDPLDTGFFNGVGDGRVLRPNFATPFGKNGGWKCDWHDRFRGDFAQRFDLKDEGDFASLGKSMSDEQVEDVRRLVFDSFRSSYARQTRKQSSETVKEEDLQAYKSTTPKERQKSRRAQAKSSVERACQAKDFPVLALPICSKLFQPGCQDEECSACEDEIAAEGLPAGTDAFVRLPAAWESSRLRFIKTKVIRPAVEAREKQIDAAPGKRGRTHRLRLVAENFEAIPPPNTPTWMVNSTWLSHHPQHSHLVDQPKASEAPQYDQLNKYCADLGFREEDEDDVYEQRLLLRRDPYRKWELAKKEAKKVKPEPEASAKGSAEPTSETDNPIVATPVPHPAVATMTPVPHPNVANTGPTAPAPPTRLNGDTIGGYFHPAWQMSSAGPAPHYGYPQYSTGPAPPLSSPPISSPTQRYPAPYPGHLAFSGQPIQAHPTFPLPPQNYRGALGVSLPGNTTASGQASSSTEWGREYLPEY
ncbi:hypothetical protein FRC00_012878 [Tulasnella sp. 408]|nr:hypothetical protein FRC00_012878 [Tulasnella sp. 408]